MTASPSEDPETKLEQTTTPHLSFSRINRYLTCPEQYRLYYLENLRPKVESANLAFGAMIHVALAEFFRQGLDPSESFLKEWDNLKTVALDYGARESWESLREKGEKLLRRFLLMEAPKLKQVLGVERKFEVAVTTLAEPFIGIVDLYAVLDGKRTIVDFKTASSGYEDHEVALSDQLTAYFLGEPEAAQVAYCVLVKTKEPRIEWHLSQRNPAHLAEFLDKVRIVAADIRAGRFYKRPGKHCAWCDFLPVCMGEEKRVWESLVMVA